jgi:ribonuclease-3
VLKRPESISALQQQMGVTFRDPALLHRALTHASYLNENPHCGWGDNQRLEFLGDAVVDFIAAEYLIQHFPDWQEGQLTAMRAEFVRSETLAAFAEEIGLGDHLLLGRGEEAGGGRTRSAMLGDALEALLGALYLDQGLRTVRQFILPFLQRHLDSSGSGTPLRDAKSRLQEWAQASLHETPSYATVRETGPDHSKLFTVEVRIAGQLRGQGEGSSKQAAEQAAAQNALDGISALDLPGTDSDT